ncbi:MAG: hypothetical protein FWG71_08855 [Synergistaceae bacterium]|nr:hypothetical protein [Synergistaceae bacterium]
MKLSLNLKAPFYRIGAFGILQIIFLSIGQVSVKHGAFLDDDVLKDAVEAAKGKGAKKKKAA